MEGLRSSIIGTDSRPNAIQLSLRTLGVSRPTLRLPQIGLLHFTDKSLSRSTLVLVTRCARDWLTIQTQVCSSILLPAKEVVYVIAISSTHFAV